MATSAPFTPTAPGTYRWIASYSGDANNAAVSGLCNAANESVNIPAVAQTNPALSTQASGSVSVGGSISDTATLSGGNSPTGTITFTLFGPDNANCSGSPIFTSVRTVSGNGSVTSASFTPTAAGTYRWRAEYSGDSNNAAVTGACNAANELVTVTSPPASADLQ
jgi:hypothetical protein